MRFSVDRWAWISVAAICAVCFFGFFGTYRCNAGMPSGRDNRLTGRWRPKDPGDPSAQGLVFKPDGYGNRLSPERGTWIDSSGPFAWATARDSLYILEFGEEGEHGDPVVYRYALASDGTMSIRDGDTVRIYIRVTAP